MTMFRRRLFWKIYIALLGSLIATVVSTGALFWFVGESQRNENDSSRHGPRDVSLFAADGHFVSASGHPITLSDYHAGRHWGPNHVFRLDLPGGGFALTHFGPPAGERAFRLLVAMLAIAGGVGLAAYPVTALLTRRLERLRAGIARWGEKGLQPDLDDCGNDEVAALARTFNAAAARLAALLASQKTLLANASHELRSPLARLRLAIEIGGRVDTHDAASKDEIVRNLTEMDQLVDELLLSSRLGHSESQTKHMEQVDLLGLAAEEGARYEAIVGGDAIEVTGDPFLLRRMIRNLLENGAKHGRPPITVVVSLDAGVVVVTVNDKGNGIEAQDRERIFEPFYRPAGLGEAAGGWGLGLALVRQIAERHGGRVECRASPAGGSCFVVSLDRSTSP